MHADDYVRKAVRTESRDFKAISLRVCSRVRLLHAGLGMATESGEFLDALKQHIYYGKPLDVTNLLEEIGDLMWYIALATDALGGSLEGIMRKNIAKLEERYPKQFCEEAALVRNTEAERKVLEGENIHGKVDAEN